MSEIAARLALHFERGRDFKRAVQYHQQAAQKAVQRGGFREAVRHATAGLELLRCLPDTSERVAHDLALHHTLGVALAATQGFAAPEVEQAYGRAWTLSQQVGDTAELFPVLWGLWRFHFARGAFETAREIGDQLLTLAQHEDDPTLALAAHQALGITLFYVGAFPVAREHLKHGMVLVHSDPRPALAVRYGDDPGVVCHAIAAQALWCLGYPDQALRRSYEACTRAQELAHPHSRAARMSFGEPQLLAPAIPPQLDMTRYPNQMNRQACL